MKSLKDLSYMAIYEQTKKLELDFEETIKKLDIPKELKNITMLKAKFYIHDIMRVLKVAYQDEIHQVGNNTWEITPTQEHKDLQEKVKSKSDFIYNLHTYLKNLYQDKIAFKNFVMDVAEYHLERKDKNNEEIKASANALISFISLIKQLSHGIKIVQNKKNHSVKFFSLENNNIELEDINAANTTFNCSLHNNIGNPQASIGSNTKYKQDQDTHSESSFKITLTSEINRYTSGICSAVKIECANHRSSPPSKINIINSVFKIEDTEEMITVKWKIGK